MEVTYPAHAETKSKHTKQKKTTYTVAPSKARITFQLTLADIVIKTDGLSALKVNTVKTVTVSRSCSRFKEERDNLRM